MRIQRRSALVGIAAVAVAAALGCGNATDTPKLEQPETAVATPQAKTLSIDPKIKVGKLANGLTYYILPHKKPAQRAYLWLGVNAGSVQEDDDQQGLAHFVEHMAFNGTEKFKKMEIVNYLESIGVRFGADLNAYTSFDQTVYQLQVPTDDPKLVTTGLEILEQWAHAISFDPEEVDKERGVVTEEWRLGKGAWDRIINKQYPTLYKGSRYAERLPIGKVDILKNAPVAALKRFYRDWYRPDLMAVVAVGDFDPKVIEEQIVTLFSPLQGPDKPRERTPIAVPMHREPIVSIESDAEMPMTMIRVLHKFPHRPEATDLDYRRFITEGIYHMMLQARFAELSQKPGSPFKFAASSTDLLFRTADSFSLVAMAKEGRAEDTLRTLLTEIERVEQHGFTAAELNRQKAKYLRQSRRDVVERDKTDGRAWAQEILRNYFEGEMMPGREGELQLVERFLPSIKLEEMNHLARSWTKNASQAVAISGPTGASLSTKDNVLGILRSTQDVKVAPYEDRTTQRPLLANTPKAGSVVDETTIPEVAVTEWKLSNGARVVFKSTDFKNDQITMQAFSPGGTSQVNDKDFLAVANAAEIINKSGAGEFDRSTLTKLLSDKVVTVKPFIGELEEGFVGNASATDVETMLQLLHLRFTGRQDDKAFAAWLEAQKDAVRNRDRSPEHDFFYTLNEKTSKNHLRRRRTTLADLGQIDLSKSLAFYRDRFADAGDFIFVFVGNIDKTTFKPLVEKYIASLPSTGRKESWKDVGVTPLRGPAKISVKKGVEDKSFVVLRIDQKTKWSEQAEADIDIMNRALRIRFREVLREDMGGVYGVFASANMSWRPKGQFTYVVGFGCSPANVDKLKRAVLDVIKEVQKRGVGAEYITKIKEQLRRGYETESQTNDFWVRSLRKHLTRGSDPRKVLEIDKRIAGISSKRIKAAARKYIDTKRFVVGVLTPEK